MKRILALVLTLALVLVLAAQQPAATEAPAPTAAPTQAPTEAPVPTIDPTAPCFIASYEDGTLAPDRIEGKIGKDNAIKLFFTTENVEGMVGWNGDFEKAGIFFELNFAFIEEKGLQLIIWADEPTECTSTMFINGSDDWANPDILYERAFTFVFSA